MHIMRGIGYAIGISLAQVSGAMAADEPSKCDPAAVDNISYEQMDQKRCAGLCRNDKRRWTLRQCNTSTSPTCISECFAGIGECHQGPGRFDKSKCNPTTGGGGSEIPGRCNLTASAEAWTDDLRLRIEPSSPKSDIRTAKDVLGNMIKGTGLLPEGSNYRSYPIELFGPSGNVNTQNSNKADALRQFSSASGAFDTLIRNMAGQANKDCWQCYIDQKWVTLNRVALYMSYLRDPVVGSGDPHILKQSGDGAVKVLKIDEVAFSGDNGIEVIPNCLANELRRLLCQGTDTAVDPGLTTNQKYRKYAGFMQQKIDNVLFGLYTFVPGQTDCSKPAGPSGYSAKCVHTRIASNKSCDNDENRDVFYSDVSVVPPLSIRPPDYWCAGYTTAPEFKCTAP